MTPKTKKGGKNPTFLEENCQKTEQITSVVKCHFSTVRAGNVEIIIMAKSIFEEKSCRNNSRELAKKRKAAERKTRKMRANFAGTRKVRISRKKNRRKKKLNQIPICQEFVQF